jgi:phospholipase/lecithinase/hemolysin
MKRYLLGTALAFCALVSTPATAAEVIFDFSGSGFFGGTLNGAGTLTTSDESTVNPLNGFTVQKITGITGIFNGSTITGLAPGVFGANNLFYLTGPFFVDGNGLGFRTASGVDVNLFVTGGTAYQVNTQGAGLLIGRVTANATTVAAAVPEPSTWMLMLLGMAGVGFSMRRKANQTLRVRYA